MEENTSQESSKSGNDNKISGKYFGRWGAIVLTAIIALIVGFAIGRHAHRHFDGCWGGAPMMMRGESGPGCQSDGAGQMRGMMGMRQDMGMQPGRGMRQDMGMQPGMGMQQGMGMQPGMGMQQGMGTQSGVEMHKGMQPGMGQGMAMRRGMGFDPAMRADAMQHALSLTDQQTEQIETIFANQQAQMQSAMRSIDSVRGHAWRAGHEQVHSQISAVLNPDQRAKWEKFMAGNIPKP